MADSPSRAEAQEADSKLSSLIYDMSQQVQTGMEAMLKMINEIDQSSNVISEDMEKCKDSALERKRTLDEHKENFQKAAFTVINMLSQRN